MQCILDFGKAQIRIRGNSHYIKVPKDWVRTHFKDDEKKEVKVSIDPNGRLIYQPCTG